jgi:hypothetical protein
LLGHAGFAGSAGFTATVHAAIHHAAIHHAATRHADIHHAAISSAAVARHQLYIFRRHVSRHTASTVEYSICLPHCRLTGATTTNATTGSTFTALIDSSFASFFSSACACAYGHRPQHSCSIHHLSSIHHPSHPSYVRLFAVLPF